MSTRGGQLQQSAINLENYFAVRPEIYVVRVFELKEGMVNWRKPQVCPFPTASVAHLSSAFVSLKMSPRLSAWGFCVHGFSNCMFVLVCISLVWVTFFSDAIALLIHPFCPPFPELLDLECESCKGNNITPPHLTCAQIKCPHLFFMGPIELSRITQSGLSATATITTSHCHHHHHHHHLWHQERPPVERCHNPRA